MILHSDSGRHIAGSGGKTRLHIRKGPGCGQSGTHNSRNSSLYLRCEKPVCCASPARGNGNPTGRDSRFVRSLSHFCSRLLKPPFRTLSLPYKFALPATPRSATDSVGAGKEMPAVRVSGLELLLGDAQISSHSHRPKVFQTIPWRFLPANQWAE